MTWFDLACLFFWNSWGSEIEIKTAHQGKLLRDDRICGFSWRWKILQYSLCHNKREGTARITKSLSAVNVHLIFTFFRLIYTLLNSPVGDAYASPQKIGKKFKLVFSFYTYFGGRTCVPKKIEKKFKLNFWILFFLNIQIFLFF